MSDVIETEDGFSLLYCEAIFPAEGPTAEELPSLVAERLRRWKAKEDWAGHLDGLLTAAAPRFAQPVPREPEGVVASYDGGEVTRGEIAAWRASLGAPLPEDASGRRPHRNGPAGPHAPRGGRRARSASTAGPGRGRHTWEEAAWLFPGDGGPGRRGDDAPEQAAVREYFEAHRDQLVVQDRFDLDVIVLRATEDGLVERYREALALRERLAAGDLDFERPRSAIALLRRPRGRLDTLDRRGLASLGRNVFRTVIELTPGEISPLVQEDLALWILRLRDTAPRRPMTFEEARARAEARLGNELATSTRSALEAGMIAALDVRLVP
ncbi:MAG: peptidylprolyl isomerase [Thermoanaerobaculia bacterium]